MANQLLRHPFRLLITGRSGLGKTTLGVKLVVNDIASQVDQILIVCPTAHLQKKYKALMETGKVTYVSTHPLQGLKDIEEIIESTQDNIAFTNENPPNPWLRYFGLIPEYKPKRKQRFLVFIDDLASIKGVKSLTRTSILDHLSIIARHVETSIIGIFQQIGTSSISFRKNLESLIAFRSNDMGDTELLMKEWNPNSALTKKESRALFQMAWNTGDFLFAVNPPLENTRFFIGFDKEIII